MSEDDKFKDIKEEVKNFGFNHSPSYVEIAFTSIPGVSGFILLFVILAMWITAFK